MNQSPPRSVGQIPLGQRAVGWALCCHFSTPFFPPVYDMKELWLISPPLSSCFYIAAFNPWYCLILSPAILQNCILTRDFNTA